MFTLDASIITSRLGLKPGCVVIESGMLEMPVVQHPYVTGGVPGTGSGSLSTSFIRSVSPTGHLHTFEFNAHRAAAARCPFLSIPMHK